MRAPSEIQNALLYVYDLLEMPRRLAGDHHKYIEGRQGHYRTNRQYNKRGLAMMYHERCSPSKLKPIRPHTLSY